MFHPGRQPRSRGRLGRGGQPVQLDAEDHQQHDPGDELRRGPEAQTGHAENPVERTPLPQPRGEAERQRERHEQHEGEQGQQQALAQPAHRQWPDRHPERVGLSPVAGDEPAQPVQVPGGQRLVQPQLVA